MFNVGQCIVVPRLELCSDLSVLNVGQILNNDSCNLVDVPDRDLGMLACADILSAMPDLLAALFEKEQITLKDFHEQLHLHGVN